MQNYTDAAQSSTEKLLDQEEEIFVEENKFMLHSQEHISPNRTDYGFQNTSVMSTETFGNDYGFIAKVVRHAEDENVPPTTN